MERSVDVPQPDGGSSRDSPALGHQAKKLLPALKLGAGKCRFSLLKCVPLTFPWTPQAARGLLATEWDRLAGSFPLTRRLAEERLATLVGVSRTPVRHALIRLHSEGLITRHHDERTDALFTSVQTRGLSIDQ